MTVDGTKFEGKQPGCCEVNGDRKIPMRDGSTIHNSDDQGDRPKRVGSTVTEEDMMSLMSAHLFPSHHLLGFERRGISIVGCNNEIIAWAILKRGF
jgi:hypothetical protein